MEKKCPGCGAVLQTVDDQQEGYIPATLYDSEDAICQRCYRLRNYGEFITIPLASDEFVKILDAANKEKCLIVYVIDIFNFDGSIIENFNEHTKNCPIYVLVNKCDVLPKSLKMQRIKEWCSKKLKEKGIDYVQLELISSLKNTNIDGLLNRILKYSMNKSIYVVGNANVGKSSIINNILKQYKNSTENLVTSSIFPGTTINVINIPINDGQYLYDTPGLMNNGCIYKYLENKNLKRVMNKKEIKPINLPLNAGQSIFIGSIACIDFVSGDSTSFILYGSPLLHIHRTKLAVSNDKFNECQKDPVYVPKANSKLNKESMDCHEFDLDSEKRVSINISGLLWFDILKGKQKVKVYVPKGIDVSIGIPLIGGGK